MNRRMFMKAVGMTMVGLAGLPLLTPKALSPIVLPECPGCAAGLPIKKVGWIVSNPHVAIINDMEISSITLTDNEVDFGHADTDTDHNILCGHVGSELHVSDPKPKRAEEVFYLSSDRKKMEVAS